MSRSDAEVSVVLTLYCEKAPSREVVEGAGRVFSERMAAEWARHEDAGGRAQMHLCRETLALGGADMFGGSPYIRKDMNHRCDLCGSVIRAVAKVAKALPGQPQMLLTDRASYDAVSKALAEMSLSEQFGPQGNRIVTDWLTAKLGYTQLERFVPSGEWHEARGVNYAEAMRCADVVICNPGGGWKVVKDRAGGRSGLSIVAPVRAFSALVNSGAHFYTRGPAGRVYVAFTETKR